MLEKADVASHKLQKQRHYKVEKTEQIVGKQVRIGDTQHVQTHENILMPLQVCANEAENRDMFVALYTNKGLWYWLIGRLDVFGNRFIIAHHGEIFQIEWLGSVRSNVNLYWWNIVLFAESMIHVVNG